jgi:ATP-binding cassette subfamily C protein CydC
LLLSQLALLLALIIVVLGGSLTGANIALVLFCVLAAFELVQALPQALQLLGKTQAAAKRVRQFAASTTPVSGYAIANLTYDLRLNNISFRYSPQSNWVLKNFSLDLPQGKKIALMGSSGSGKTTLLQLLIRAYIPEQGEILLGNQAINQLNHDELLRCFGVLSQRSQLFAATIKNNLLIAKPQATEVELTAAIAFAGLTSLVQKLPEGINTWVGESGVKVSGGEARRIALARLYLKNPPILLLDEPTEGLDAETEREILTALLSFAKDKTLLMATHRTVGFELVDSIINL